MRNCWRKVSVCMTAVVLTGSLFGCSGRSGQAEAVESVVADGVLTVGIIDGQDAYAKKNQGEFTGMEPEIAALLGESLGVAVEYKEAENGDALIELLNRGEVDFAAGRLAQLDRYAGTCLLTRNYAKRGLYLVVKQGLYTDSLAGFADETIGVSGEIPASKIAEIPYIGDLQRTDYASAEAMGRDIEDGIIAAAVCTEREAMELLRSGAQVQAAELRNSPKMEAVFYMPAGQYELQAAANQAINTFLDRLSQEE